MRDQCITSPFCWTSNIFLIFGTVLTIFGLFSPFWYPMRNGVENLLFVCDSEGNNCETINDTDMKVYGSRGMIALGIFFALLSVVTGFFICCCCPDAWDGNNHAMLAVKFAFMTLAGALVLGGVIWWGVKTWKDWEDCTSKPSLSYAYYLTCAGAACLLMGGALTAAGLFFERETDHHDDDQEKNNVRSEVHEMNRPESVSEPYEMPLY